MLQAPIFSTSTSGQTFALKGTNSLCLIFLLSGYFISTVYKKNNKVEGCSNKCYVKNLCIDGEGAVFDSNVVTISLQ